MIDWFERLTGFTETNYQETRAKLEIQGRRLRSLVNQNSYGIGELKLLSLTELRERAKADGRMEGIPRLHLIRGDAREMHRKAEYAGATFQVASQFNLLEMTNPNVTPEDGVTRYQCDHTQGPACAIAAGAATIYRNYFARVGSEEGQTAQRQINALADLGSSLGEALKKPVEELWIMKNGYAFPTETSLAAIDAFLNRASAAEQDELRGKLRVGLHRDVEVTDDPQKRQTVSQVFCSALPLAYRPSIPKSAWTSFAKLILEAAYEATLWSAVLNAQSGCSNTVLLTLLGGGVFGNDLSWIHGAIRRSLLVVRFDLEVKIVSFGRPSGETIALISEFSSA